MSKYESFYTPASNEQWPSLQEIHTDVDFKEYDIPKKMLAVFKKKLEALKLFNENNKYLTRYLVIFTIECLILNKTLLETGYIKKIFNIVQEKIGEKTGLDKYREHIRRDLDPEYREQAKLSSKRKYIEHVFKSSELGLLVAKNIADLYTD